MSAKDCTHITLHLLLDLLERVEKIAAAENQPAVVDVIRLGLAWALPQIAKRGLLIKPW